MAAKKYVWFTQTLKLDEKITATHDPLVEWHPDPKGYFLIRVNQSKKRIELGYVTNQHVITKAIYGKNAMDLYHTVVRHKLITRLEHAAYLGKEFYKAELCLRYGKEYKQEFPINFKDKEVVKLKVNS
ncbi:DUF4346 domain-containing protein [Candidatus Woesearchaeota archaeon]|nr:DUF4346 domain-containing protein [Candidatus Woesearchaeota archaeon]